MATITVVIKMAMMTSLIFIMRITSKMMVMKDSNPAREGIPHAGPWRKEARMQELRALCAVSKNPERFLQNTLQS